MLNSRLGLFTATPSRSTCESSHANGAHLLPKLRCHFAEFLNERSLKRLRILSLPTCVGLRYDHQNNSLEDFLGSMGSASLRDKISPHHLSELNEIPDLPKISSYRLEPGRPTPGWLTLLRPPFDQSLRLRKDSSSRLDIIRPDSLERPRIFFPPTCVGFQYGP